MRGLQRSPPSLPEAVKGFRKSASSASALSEVTSAAAAKVSAGTSGAPRSNAPATGSAVEASGASIAGASQRRRRSIASTGDVEDSTSSISAPSRRRPKWNSTGDEEPASPGLQKKKEKREPRQPALGVGEATEAAAEAFTVGLCWSLEELSVLQAIEFSTMSLSCEKAKLEVDAELRTLCHGPKDGITLGLRLCSRQVILVLGDFSRAAIPWVGLVQPAVRLHLSGLNILFVDIPSFNSDKAQYMKCGPEMVINLIEQLGLRRPNVLAKGVGGAVFLQALTSDPSVFGATHLLHTISFPEVRGASFDAEEFAKSIAWKPTQVWLCYSGQAPARSQSTVHGQLAHCQKRLQDERRGKAFDEILISEDLGTLHALDVGEHGALMFSVPFLGSLEQYFSNAPDTRQATLQGVLIADRRKPMKEFSNNLVPMNTCLAKAESIDTIIANVARRREKMMTSGPARKQMLEDYKAMKIDFKDSKLLKLPDDQPNSPLASMSKQSTRDTDSLREVSSKRPFSPASPSISDGGRWCKEPTKRSEVLPKRSASEPSLPSGMESAASTPCNANGKGNRTLQRFSNGLSAIADLFSNRGGRKPVRVAPASGNDEST